MPDHKAAVEFILEAIAKAGYQPGKDICLGFDVASSELFENGHYRLSGENRLLSCDEFIDYLAQFVEHYPVISIEDGLAENDWEGWKKLSARLGNKVQLVGDDLFVTNTSILEQASPEGCKLHFNQAESDWHFNGNVSCDSNGEKASYTTVFSHRSGETEDATIADIAVGTNAGQIKTGSLCRTDRVAKYNQLLRI